MERFYLLWLPVILVAVGAAGGTAGVILAHTAGSTWLPLMTCVACGALIGQNFAELQDAWKYR